MKTTKLKIAILGVTGSVVLSACEKFLEQAPDMRTELNSVQKVEQLLVSAYPKSDYIAFTEMASDNAEDKGQGSIPPLEYAAPYHWQDHIGTNRGTTTHYWNQAYTAIAAANHALAAIEENGDGPEYQPYKGEALVARAYAHFMLVTLYATVYKPGSANNAPGIPYVTEPETVVVKQYDRGTVASVYEHIERDLMAGLPLIRNSAYTKIPQYHFNLAAANAFAARFYLFKGEFDKVIHHANLIFPSGDWASNIRPWSTTYKNFTVNELLASFTRANQKPNLLLIEANSVWNRSITYRYGFGEKLNDKLFRAPNVTGKRFYHTIWIRSGVPNYHLGKTQEHFHYTGPGIGLPHCMIPAFTADEALMNRAEAYARSGQFALALNDINTFFSTRIEAWDLATDGVTLEKIRDFYGIEDPQEGIVKTILDAKRAEFIQEGLRWFDIIRHDIVVEHNIIDATGNEMIVRLEPGDPRRIFQIPEEAMLSGVEQNPRP